jgi:transaldolase/glucose-6-phosphate isomerase
MREDAELVQRFADDALAEHDAVVLLGMGGSSLAPAVLADAFDAEEFHVLDTTHPQAIRALESQLDISRTLFIAASKSGTTLETRAQADYFWAKNYDGSHWAAITDPGSELARLAAKRKFRAAFAGEPTIGGRYSALSAFGMVPAALMGADITQLLDRAAATADGCRLASDNPGLELGLALGEGWQHGMDKICMQPGIDLGLWVEQLLAESTGKQGKGLVPALGETATGPDRQNLGLALSDPYDLGHEFFRWEFGTAIAGSILEVNPFDQPDVQAAKDRTNELLERPDSELADEGSLDELLAQAGPGDYVCIQAFVNPTPETRARIDALVARIRAATTCVVTSEIGPRYLHSTGQLHKGGPDTGLFLQIVEDYGDELKIPHRKFGFARLIRAQAAGDLAALKERGRRVARVRLDDI